ncbi:DUF1800 family protein [Xylophilus sp. Kf1]|nr:DUF1800 family protein [Xylophilus sp. Kf1]
MTDNDTSLLPASATAPEDMSRPAIPAGPADAPASRTWLAASLAAATAALQACGGGGGGGGGDAAAASAGATSPTGTASAGASGAGAAGAGVATGAAGGAAGPLGQARTFVSPANDFDAARFLLQAQLDASDADIASVRSLGYAGYLARQFDLPGSTTAWDWLNQRGYGAIDANAYYDSTYPADFAVWRQLFTAPDAMRKRMALALSEIFVVSTTGITTTWGSHVVAAWWDMLSANTFGNFRQLLEDVTLHPAMGLYLNTRGSLKENAAGRQPDENYAREVMQLMTIGLVRLNADGSPVTLGGVPVETYGQSDVTNLARVFSGYDFDQSGNVNTPVSGRNISTTAFTRRPMVLNPANHSTADVAFLGTAIAGGTEGNAARKQALDTLFNHPNVGPFIGRQLIQRLVTSNPGPAYIARVSAAFADNGKGVRGDLGAMLAAVLLDDEARDPAGTASRTFGRLREPMLRLVQWGRTFGLNSAAGSWKIPDLSALTQLGQSPLRSGSVFNFFRPGYVPPATAIASAGLVAPEFQLVNETTVSTYVNFMQNAARNGLYATGPDLPQAAGSSANGYDMTCSHTAEKALLTNAAALVARLNLLLAAGQLSTATVALIVSALNSTPLAATATDAAKSARLAAAVLMVMASPEYLVQK